MVNEARAYQLDNRQRYVVYYKNRLVIQTSYKHLAISVAKAINTGEKICL
jgi:hypothetical protein